MGDAAVAQANATVDIVHEIATILDTGLSKEEVAIIIALIENGVNPQASHLAGRRLLLNPHASAAYSHQCMYAICVCQRPVNIQADPATDLKMC